MMMNTTNEKNYLLEYYKRNVDVHILWLSFLLEMDNHLHGNLSVLPYLNSLRDNAYLEFEEDKKVSNATVANEMSKGCLTEILMEANLMELNNYLGAYLKNSEFITMVQVVFVRDMVRSMRSNISSCLKVLGNSEQEKLLKSLGQKLIAESPEISLNVSCMSENLLAYFASFLGIFYEKNVSMLRYLFSALSYMDEMNALLSIVLDIPFESKYDELRREIRTEGNIQNVQSLLDIVVYFDNAFGQLLEKCSKQQSDEVLKFKK